MKCIKCGEEITDGASFCQYCGADQNATSSLANELKSYPTVYKSFVQVVKLIKEKNYDFAANAMRKTVESMVDFIFSSCKNSNSNLSLNEQIELLKINNLITPLSYNNYTQIRLFGNEHSHISNKTVTLDECKQYYNLLITEIMAFVNTYSKVNYSNIVIEQSKDKSKIIFNFCRNIFIRLFGLVFTIGGGFFAYEGFCGTFSDDIFGVVFGIMGSFFCLVGLSIVIGGAKALDFIEKISGRL